MKFAIYQSKPSKFEAIGNGSYAYRWNIQEEQVEVQSAENEATETKTQWKCYEVIVWATVTENKIKEAVIAALWGNSVEQKLLNDYNAAQQGVLAPEAAQWYCDFLVERDAVKAEIHAVCVEFNIAKEVVSLESAKADKLKVLAVHDKSSAVNEFFVGGELPIWIDRETRSSLFFSTTAEKQAGAAESTLYLGANVFTYPIDDMLAMLSAVELYAKECYKATQQHIQAINKLTTVAKVKSYNITKNYPAKLHF